MFISIQFFPQCIMRSAQRCHAEGGRVPFWGILGKAWETQQSSTFFAPGTDWFRRGLGEGGRAELRWASRVAQFLTSLRGVPRCQQFASPGVRHVNRFFTPNRICIEDLWGMRQKRPRLIQPRDFLLSEHLAAPQAADCTPRGCWFGQHPLEEGVIWELAP